MQAAFLFTLNFLDIVHHNHLRLLLLRRRNEFWMLFILFLNHPFLLNFTLIDRIRWIRNLRNRVIVRENRSLLAWGWFEFFYLCYVTSVATWDYLSFWLWGYRRCWCWKVLRRRCVNWILLVFDTFLINLKFLLWIFPLNAVLAGGCARASALRV